MVAYNLCLMVGMLIELVTTMAPSGIQRFNNVGAPYRGDSVHRILHIHTAHC